jgi:hypothetical protein
MFTWICPQCGREVPPSYTECPDCTERAKQAPAAAQPPQPQYGQPQYGQPQYAPPQYAPQPPAAQQPQPQQPVYAPPPPPASPAQPQQQYYAPPPQAHQPQQPYPAPPPYYAPQPAPAAHKVMSLPIWLMTILFALAIGGVVGAIYWLLPANRGSAGTGPTPTATVESPAAKPGAKTNPLQKFIEVSGVRFVQDEKKKGTLAKFVIINHSESEIGGLAGNVTIWGRTQKSEEDAQGTFSFTTNLGPYESKEISAPVNTKLKIYELPDWQNITTDVQITSPGA